MPDIKVPKGSRAKILITIDEDGKIVDATDEYGNELEYGDEERARGKKLHNTSTRLLCPNVCCWRNIGGKMYCHPAFC